MAAGFSGSRSRNFLKDFGRVSAGRKQSKIVQFSLAREKQDRPFNSFGRMPNGFGYANTRTNKKL
jgi:hypothetical protein